MPRLFDLLSDNSRKDLLSEAKKAVPIRNDKKSKHKDRENDAPKQKHVLYAPDFVAFDVETTGLEFKNDRIIEIGAVRFINGKPADEFTTLVNPGVPIPEYITDLTGISTKDVENAPSFETISEKFLQFLNSMPLCGHQIEFDLTFLNEELKRLGKPTVSCQLIDTALLSRILLSPNQRFSLKAVSEHLKVELNNAHRALHDAKASGEVAVTLIPRIADLSLSARQTMAACAPGSLVKSLIIRSLGHVHSGVTINTNRSSGQHNRLPLPESFIDVDRAGIENIFSSNGALNRCIEAFTVRDSQRDMALQVTDALNTRSILVAEAGTGTGKSLAYCIPAAMWALTNNCRVIVSTRTRNLQDQLITKDLPVAIQATGKNIRYTVLKGRSNYLCLSRWEKMLLGEAGSLSPRERYAILPLIPWTESTKTGDIEEQNQFNPKWFSKIWNLISAESHECGGRRCPFFQSCFLQNARQKALSSHVVVINHALFFSEVCSENSFLGNIGSIIFDEAHHLESSGHRFLRVEFDTARSNLFIETINNLVLKIANLDSEKEIYETGKKLRNQLKNLRKRAQELLSAFAEWAKKNQTSATQDYQITYNDTSFEFMQEPIVYEMMLSEILDSLRELKQAIASHPKADDFEDIDADAQTCLERTSQLKADLQYLRAAKTEDHVFWIEGNHDKGWTKLCGVPLDVGGLLSDIWERCSGGIVFTSATLSVAKSIEYFKRGVGISKHESRTATSVFKSPFNSNQAIYGAMKTAPDPDNPQFPMFVADVIRKFHQEFEKNVLVLFTANSMLSSVFELLKADPSVNRNKLLAQGVSGTRNTILEQFKQNQRMILLGTDSFWEGIDVPGEACEVVIIPRLPFPVPTHPLTQALSKKMEKEHGESFFSFSIPEAVIKFRQGVGRLIRTSTDRGALVVLDNRILTKGYGKQFVRSVDSEFKNFADIDSMASEIKEFFATDPADIENSKISYVPLEDI